jgi:hypothetical protein
VLASLIWKEEGDRTLLPNATVFHGFELKLRGLQDKDLQIRLSISYVLRRFTSAPFNMVMLECCFCKEI